MAQRPKPKPALKRPAAARDGELIWARLDGGARARSGLGYPQIVKAALRIADSEGLDAISMRRIAARLDSGTMSLYRYVSSKDQILDLLLDAAYGEIDVPERPSHDWRRDLSHLARETRRVLKRHSWLGPLLTSRPTLGPHYLRWFEFSLAATAAAGFDIRTGTRIIGSIQAYVMGVVGYELGEAETNRRYNLSEERKRELAAPYIERILATGLYPNLARFLEHGTAEVTDADFDFGLNAMVQGLARELTPARRVAAH